MRQLLASWRVALRLARREAARARGRSALVALLIGLPMVLAGFWDVSWRSDQVHPDDVVATTLGSRAQAWVQAVEPGHPVTFSFATGVLASSGGNGPSPASAAEARRTVRAMIPAADDLVARVSAGSVLVGADGRTGVLEALEWDYGRVPGLVRQTAGRPPARPGEAAVDETFARDNRLALGSVVTAADPARPGTPASPITVVGTYRWTPSKGEYLPAVTAFPGSFPEQLTARDAAEITQWWVVGPEPVTRAQVLALARAGFATLGRHTPPAPFGDALDVRADDGISSRPDVLVVAGVALGMLLLQIALMAGPAMAVGARRSEQALALVAACGGHRVQLRRQVLAGALVSGTLGSALGVAGGVVVTVLVRRDPGAPVALAPPLHVEPLDLVALVALGAAIAVGAALFPARQASRMDVVAALGGRPAMSAPRLRTPVLGLVAVVVGAGVALWGATAGLPAVVSVGAAASELGLVAAIGTMVALAARLAGRLPIAGRLALRDGARHRTRTTPAIAAAMAALAAATAWLLVGTSYDHRTVDGDPPPAHSRTVAVALHAEQQVPLVRDWGAVAAAARAHLPVRASVPVRQVVRSASGEDVDVETPSCTQNGTDGTAACRSPDPEPERTQSVDFPFYRWVDDGTVLDLVTGGVDPDAVRALRNGRSVVWDPLQLRPDGTVLLTWAGRRVPVPGYLAMGPERLSGVALSEAAVQRLGAAVRPTGLALTVTRPPTTAELDRARAAVLAASGLLVEHDAPVVAYDSGTSPGRRRTTLMIGAILAAAVALAGVLAAVALVAAEGRADRATLAAVGGPPGLRRRVAAAQALLIAGFGAVLGLVAGSVGGYALIEYLRHDNAGFEINHTTIPLVVPWWQLLALTLGVPVVAATVSALATRSRLELVRRRGA